MAKSLRYRIGQILYAGLKPATRGAQDPLYLSNRTFRKKVIVASAVIVPFVAIGALVSLAAAGYFTPKASLVIPAPADTVQAMLPDLDKLKIQNSAQVEVIETHFNRGANPSIIGTLRNHSSRPIHSGEVIFDLANNKGAQVGRFSIQLSNLAPETTMTFHAPLLESDAAFAFVREVITK